jgi:hypothetical protein
MTNKYDQTGVFILWAGGMGVREIAVAVGAHRSTIGRILTRVGVTPEERQRPHARLAKCSRGHDMKKHWKPNPKKARGGGYCSECKRMRDRAYLERKRKRKTDGRPELHDADRS